MKISEVHIFNQDKLEACYHYILDWIVENCESVNIQNILFLSDIENMNKYGHSITGMDYSFIDGKIVPSKNPRIGHDLKTHEEHMDYFSKSDIECIDLILNDRPDLEFDYSQLKEGDLHIEDLPVDEEVIAELEEIKGLLKIVC